MLVLQENGEQRLITFTLSRDACTIRDILEQVKVPFTPDMNIEVTEINTNSINYVVAVGNVTCTDECVVSLVSLARYSHLSFYYTLGGIRFPGFHC